MYYMQVEIKGKEPLPQAAALYVCSEQDIPLKINDFSPE